MDSFLFHAGSSFLATAVVLLSLKLGVVAFCSIMSLPMDALMSWVSSLSACLICLFSFRVALS